MNHELPQFGAPEMLEDPFPFFEDKRAHCPVFSVPSRNVHIVTRREDIEFVALNPETFSNKGRASLETFPGQRYKTMPDLTSMDGAQHRAVREAHMAFVSPKRLREMRPTFEAEASRLIDTFVDEREIDFLPAFAKPFPAWVMGSALLGLPREMHPQLDIWAANYFELFDKNLHHGGTNGPDPRLIDSFVEFTNFCGDLAVSHRENPQDTPLSEFVNFVKSDGTLYNMDEMASFIRLLVVGAQTSTNLMAQALVDAIRAGSSVNFSDRREAQKLLDESLRLDGPATYGPRLCTKDVEVGGVHLPAGSRIMLAWQSGNRDEETFENPKELWPNRPKLAKQLGYGLGAHRCIGAPLAQLEGEVALQAMFSRFKSIRLSPKNDFRHDTSLTSMRNLLALHLELEAA